MVFVCIPNLSTVKTELEYKGEDDTDCNNLSVIDVCWKSEPFELVSHHWTSTKHLNFWQQRASNWTVNHHHLFSFSQTPLSQDDELALMAGYAAAMDASMSESTSIQDDTTAVASGPSSLPEESEPQGGPSGVGRPPEDWDCQAAEPLDHSSLSMCVSEATCKKNRGNVALITWPKALKLLWTWQCWPEGKNTIYGFQVSRWLVPTDCFEWLSLAVLLMLHLLLCSALTSPSCFNLPF